MGSFLFALNAVLPIVLMVAAGYGLKRVGLFNTDLAKQVNKLVFKIFIPTMLFVSIYDIKDIADVDFGYIIYAMIVVVAIFALSIPFYMAVTKDNKKRGSLIQSSFRSNFALIGIPLATALFGTEGGSVAAVLLAVVVPVFNILAVISLSLFRNEKGADVKKILIGIASNPLIHGVVLGFGVLLFRSVFIELGVEFRLTDIAPAFKVVRNLGELATPLALLVLGAQFEFSAVSEMKRDIIIGTFVRVVINPLIGIGLAYLLFRDTFTGAHFAALVATFATPVAVSSVPMAQEMDSDVKLAGQLVVWTTICSGFTIFIISFLLSLDGIFPTL